MLLLRYLIKKLSKYPKGSHSTFLIKYPGAPSKGTVLDKKRVLGYLGYFGYLPGKPYWTWLLKVPYKIISLIQGYLSGCFCHSTLSTHSSHSTLSTHSSLFIYIYYEREREREREGWR